jgi:membrane protein
MMRIFTKKSAAAETVSETATPVPTQPNGNLTEEIPAGAIVTDEVEDPKVPPVPEESQVPEDPEVPEAIQVPEPPVAETPAEPEAWLDQTDPEDFQAPKRGFFFVTMRTVREFIRHEAFDMAAALTYYSIFAIFPALIALFSMIGIVGNPDQVIRKVAEALDPLVRDSTIDRVVKVLEGVAASSAAGWGVIIGIALALWSASAYTNAFRRMINRIYEVPEGRAVWKLRPLMFLVTVASLTLVTASVLLMIVTGPISKAIGKSLGVGEDVAQLWDWLKLPVLLVIVVMVVALLYQTTPNVKLSKFRVISAGSVVAILAIIVASIGLAFYVRNFGSYNRIYGSLAGVIVFLLWTWVVNMSLLFGAELDSELERGRQLHDGLPAEERLQSPLRDDKAVEKANRTWAKIEAKDRAVRESVHGAGDLGDRPFTKSR